MKLRIFVLFTWCLFVNAADHFHESVKVKLVNMEQAYSFFNFTTNWEYEEVFVPQHYRVFPRSIGQLILKYNVAELHFTLTRGLWRYKQWGFPYAPSPTGAQLWVWFNKDTPNVDQNWIGFTKAFSGLFCASLNIMDKAVTVSPKVSFRPSGVVENGKVNNTFVRYAALARENLCTENLTPWMKLLPCGSRSGPSSLLNPSQLHSSRFLSVGLHFTHECSGVLCNNFFVQLQQHLSTIHDIHSIKRKSDFSLVSLFNREIKPSCPLASSSQLSIKSPFKISTVPDLTHLDDGSFHLDLSIIKSKVNVKVNRNIESNLKTLHSEIVSHCYITGLGLEGGVQCLITNNIDQDTTIMFFYVIPWFLHTQLHTMKILDNVRKPIHPKVVYFDPARIRHSPHKLEVVFTLPASSAVQLSIQFTRGFMMWDEHPPDANHGFYISPSVITVRGIDLNFSKEHFEEVYRIYSEALLVNIPVPDFSMPYNVICLVCTVLAIAFGSLVNLITKRFHLMPANTPHPLKKKLLALLDFVRRKPS